MANYDTNNPTSLEDFNLLDFIASNKKARDEKEGFFKRWAARRRKKKEERELGKLAEDNPILQVDMADDEEEEVVVDPDVNQFGINMEEVYGDNYWNPDADVDTTVTDEEIPIVDKGDVTSNKKTSTQKKITNFTQRAQDIKDRYKSGEISKFQRNRENRKLRRDAFKQKEKLSKDVKKMTKGPLGKFTRKTLLKLKELSPALIAAKIQSDSAGEVAGGTANAWSPTEFNQTLNLNPVTNPYNQILQSLLRTDMIR